MASKRSLTYLKNLVVAILLATTVLPLAAGSIAMAASSASVLITATPIIGFSGFTITYINPERVDFNWNIGGNVVAVMIRGEYNEYPEDIPDPLTAPTDGYLVYYGNGVSASDTSMDFEENPGPIHYRAWAELNDGTWISPPAEGTEESRAVTLLALALIAASLTVALFITKNALLGFPCVIFWAVLGGYAYVESAGAWADWQFFLAMGSLMGMVPFSSLVAFALRKKDLSGPDADKGRYIDERSTETGFENSNTENREDNIDDPSKPSRRTMELRKRAAERRTGSRPNVRWGEFK